MALYNFLETTFISPQASTEREGRKEEGGVKCFLFIEKENNQVFHAKKIQQNTFLLSELVVDNMSNIKRAFK